MKTAEELQAELDAVTAKQADTEKQLAAVLAKQDELLSETKAAKAAKKAAEEKAALEAEELLRKSGDVSALEKSWQAKYEKLEADKNSQIEAINGNLNGLLVDNVASKIANDLALPGSADLLMPHIKSRLATEIKDGKAVTVVRDLSGKPSALTVEELAKEISANQAFAPVLVGSKATGGGAGGGKGGSATGKTLSRADFDALDQFSRSEFSKNGGTLTD